MDSVTAEQPAKPRTHDADLRGHDRVSLLLDLDRDYSTAFHFEVDERGCIADDCWGDKTWDPRWFVAVQNSDTEWTVEAAIPLAALTGDGVTPGEALSAGLGESVASAIEGGVPPGAGFCSVNSL